MRDALHALCRRSIPLPCRRRSWLLLRQLLGCCAGSLRLCLRLDSVRRRICCVRLAACTGEMQGMKMRVESCHYISFFALPASLAALYSSVPTGCPTPSCICTQYMRVSSNDLACHEVSPPFGSALERGGVCTSFSMDSVIVYASHDASAASMRVTCRNSVALAADRNDVRRLTETLFCARSAVVAAIYATGSSSL